MEIVDVKNPFRAPLLYRQSTDSTMNDARRAVEEGCPHGTVAAAGSQSAGRGRLRGRRWECEPGKGLLFTLILRQPPPWGGGLLPLVCAHVLARILEEKYALSPEIKWPNDLLLKGAKVSGVLCEQDGDVYYIGIGINLTPQQFSSPFAHKPGALSEYIKEPVEGGEILYGFLEGMHRSLDTPREELLPALRQYINSRLYRRGREAVLRWGHPRDTQDIPVIIEEVGINGELWVRVPEDEKIPPELVPHMQGRRFAVISGEILPV